MGIRLLLGTTDVISELLDIPPCYTSTTNLTPEEPV